MISKWVSGGIAFVATALVGLAVGQALKSRAKTNALQDRVSKALAKKDRAELTSIAALLRKQGNAEAAETIEAEIKAFPALRGAPSMLRQVEHENAARDSRQTAGVVTADSGTPEDPHRAFAQLLTDHLKSHPRGSEDRDMVQKFQDAEKLNRDGRYGPGAASRILQRYGIIPVPPYYWSKGAQGREQKRKFIAFVRKYASGDQERADQYDALINGAERS